MSDAPETPPDDAQSAYEQALAGGYLPSDAPGREVTSFGGVPIEKVEKKAREDLEAIQQLRGRKPEDDAPAPKPEPQAQPESPAEPQRELSREEAAARLLGLQREPLTPEEAEYLDQIESDRQLRTGAAAASEVGLEAEMGRAISDLEQRLPGVQNPRFAEKFEPVWNGLLERYPDLPADPQLAVEQVERAYAEMGGEDAFGPSSSESQEAAYARAVTGGKGATDPYGIPLPDDDPAQKAYKEALGGVEADLFGFPKQS